MLSLKWLFKHRRLTIPVYFSFIVLFYLLFVRQNISHIEVELYLDSEHSGIFEVFSPISKDRYSQDSSSTVLFPQGESGHLFTMKPINRGNSIRIDPIAEPEQQLTIKKIVFKHLGFIKTIEGDSFSKYLQHFEQAHCQLAKDGLRIKSTGPDPKIFMSTNVVPFNSLSMLAGIILLTGIFPLIVLYQLRSYAHSQTLLIQIIACMGLLVLILSFLNLRMDTLFSALTYVLLGHSILVLSFLVIKNNLSNTYNSQLNIVILFTWSIIIILWSVTSLSKDIHQTILDGLVSDKQPQSSLLSKVVTYKNKLNKTYIKLIYGGKQLKNWDAKVKIFGLNFTPNAKTILGKEQWFFEGHGSRRVEQGIIKHIDNITDYIGLDPFSHEELTQWNRALEERYYWLKERGIDYIFALAPTKAMIYPEKLPEKIYQLKCDLDRPTRYTQLINYLKLHSIVPVVDLKAAMFEARHKHQWPLFYRTDFHWNYLGSFYAYQAIIRSINKHYPKYNLSPMSIDEFRIKPKYNWAHPRFLLLAGLYPREHKDDTYLRLFPTTDSHYSITSDFYTRGIADNTIPTGKKITFENGKKTIKIRKLLNPEGTLDSIFVIGDSFSKKMLGYFSAHSKIVYNYRTVTQFMPEPFKQSKPQLVIQEVLNMYVIDKPPTNIAEIKAARIRFLQKNEHPL